MEKINAHLALLGLSVEDKVTKFKGIVTSVTFDLYGCIQGLVVPVITDDKPKGDPLWFDVNRLKITDKIPVMDRPNFVEGPQAEGSQGGADKPIP